MRCETEKWLSMIDRAAPNEIMPVDIHKLADAMGAGWSLDPDPPPSFSERCRLPAGRGDAVRLAVRRGKALAPARVAEDPAQLLLGFGVGGTARLSGHDDDNFASNELCQRAGE